MTLTADTADLDGIVVAVDLRRRYGEGEAAIDALDGVSVAFIFQSFNLLPVLDARENILLPLSIAGRDGMRGGSSSLWRPSASAIV